jgi:hypothetical protein
MMMMRRRRRRRRRMRIKNCTGMGKQDEEIGVQNLPEQNSI